MGFSLKKLLEGATAQVNPFDSGKTFATVVRNQPVQSQPAKTPPPSYGSNPFKQAINRTRDVFDANTPQDYARRSRPAPMGVPTQSYQEQQRANPSNFTKLRNVVNGTAKVVGAPVIANVDIARAGIGQVTGNQIARNNALKSATDNSLKIPRIGLDLAKGMVQGPVTIGKGLAQLSADKQNAEKAQQNLIDQLNKQKLDLTKNVKTNGFTSQADYDRKMKYADNLWNNEAQARQAQISDQTQKYSDIDPVKQALAIADTGLTALSFGVAGATKQGAKAVAGETLKNQLQKGVGKEVATQLAKKAGGREILRQSALTGSMGGFQGAINPYIVKDKGTVTPTDVFSGALIGTALGGALPATFVGAGYAKDGLKNLNRIKLNQAGAVGKNILDDGGKAKGAPIEKTPTKMPNDPLEALKQEARKYKSAEEFGDSLNAMKYGKVTGVGQLPVSKINKTQIKALTERGLPHTDTNLKVSDFKPGRQVTQPLEVYSKGGSWVVENGNHRLAQALANGDETVPVVFKGGEGKKYSTPITDLYNQAKGAPIEKTPTKMPNDPLEALKAEARKYKSADEFVKAQTNAYHGTDATFDTFDNNFRGAVTQAKSAKNATFFTDDPRVAKAYATYAAENRPVIALQNEADRLEKIAQHTNNKEDWLKYDAVVAKMEEVGNYDNTFNRRSLANVKNAKVSGDFLEVDAKGKSPQELSADGNIDSWLQQQIDKAKAQGKDGVKFTNLDDGIGLYDVPSTHYAVFDNSKVLTEKQLTDLYNQAHTEAKAPKVEAPKGAPIEKTPTKMPNDPLEALKQEARKYKSADEFIKSQPLSYHGTDQNLNKFNNKQGTWFTDDYFNADGYANGVNVYEGRLSLNNPLIIDGKGKKWDDLNTKYGKTTQEIVGNVDKSKHDGVIFKNIKDNWIDDAEAQSPGTVTYAFDPTKSFLNESQLTDLYNQATKPSRLNPFKDQVGAIGKNIRDDSPTPIEKTPTQTPFGPVKAKTDPGLDPVVNRTQKVVEMQQKSEKLLPESKPTSKMLTKDSVKASSSNNTPDQNELPLYKTHQVSNLDKAFRSTRSIIERQGEKGKQLAGMLQKQRDTKELYVREIEKQISTVQSLKGKDYENFVDATQGLAKPNNPKVAQAVKEWQSVHPGIRNRAVNAGLDVGDLGETYYPHFIDYDKIFKNKNTYNEAINHLVKTGQAETPEKAIELLSYARDVSRNRKFGNLEASRLVDLPFYDKSKASLGMYIDGSADRITKTEMFGKGDENALKLIKEAGLDGYDTEAMKNAYDVAVGAKQYNPTTSKISKGIRQFTTTTRLGLGALTNVSQSVNTGIVTGHLRTMKSIIKQFDPKTRQLAEDTGVISDAILNDLKHGFGAEYNKGKFGKVVNAITAPGFKQVESFNRRVAATAGRDYALRLAQKGDEATLRKLGVTGVIKNGTLTNSQQTQAARKIVEKTQFKVDPQDLPGWADSPGGKLVAQFRTFSYNQGKFFSNEILKPLAKGNIMPLGRLMAALPLGYGLYEVRRKIDGRPEEENKAKVGLQSFQKIGGAGLVFDIYQGLNPVGSKYLPSDRRVTMAFGTIGGPSIGTAGNAIGAISEAIQRKNTPKDESRLGGKVVVAKNDNSYTDLTAISRFGMQQVPIIGTAMANRVLPYKKQAEAEAGKPLGTNQTQMTREDQLKDAKNSIKYGAGKEWQNLSEEDIKNKAIAGDQTAAGIYKSLQTMEKVYGAKNIPTPGLSTAAEDVLNQSKKITKEGESAWGSRPTENKNAQKAISQLAGEELQVDNATAEKWAKYERDRVTGKINELDKVKIQRDILKSAYSSTLSADEKKYFDYNDTDLINALQNGSLKPDSLAKAMSVDAQLVAKGLITTSGFGKKVWNALGLAYPSVKGTSTKARTSSRRVASKKLKTTKTISLDTFKKYKTRRSSTNASLRKLLGSAKV